MESAIAFDTAGAQNDTLSPNARRSLSRSAHARYHTAFYVRFYDFLGIIADFVEMII